MGHIHPQKSLPNKDPTIIMDAIAINGASGLDSIICNRSKLPYTKLNGEAMLTKTGIAIGIREILKYGGIIVKINPYRKKKEINCTIILNGQYFMRILWEFLFSFFIFLQLMVIQLLEN
jgi:hypothetical protein